MKSGTVPHLDTPVSRLVCGTDWMILVPPQDSFKALDAYWAAGGRTFDCAHTYGANTSIFAAWLNHRQIGDDVVILDKVAHPAWINGAMQKRVSRAAIREEVERNHDRLRRGVTDLLVLHRDDLNVPVGEIVEWLNELKDEGRVRVFGASNWTHERIAAANDYAVQKGKQGFSLDNPNLTLAHNSEPLWDDCLTIGENGRQWHERTQLPLFSWSSTARGYFARSEDPDVIRAYDNPTSRARRDRAESFGRERGLSATQVALAWVLNQPFPTFALSGLRTPENVKENVAALDLELTPEEVRWLEHGNNP